MSNKVNVSKCKFNYKKECYYFADVDKCEDRRNLDCGTYVTPIEKYNFLLSKGLMKPTSVTLRMKKGGQLTILDTMRNYCISLDDIEESEIAQGVFNDYLSHAGIGGRIDLEAERDKLKKNFIKDMGVLNDS